MSNHLKMHNYKHLHLETAVACSVRCVHSAISKGMAGHDHQFVQTQTVSKKTTKIIKKKCKQP